MAVSNIVATSVTRSLLQPNNSHNVLVQLDIGAKIGGQGGHVPNNLFGGHDRQCPLQYFAIELIICERFQ